MAGPSTGKLSGLPPSVSPTMVPPHPTRPIPLRTMTRYIRSLGMGGIRAQAMPGAAEPASPRAVGIRDVGEPDVGHAERVRGLDIREADVGDPTFEGGSALVVGLHVREHDVGNSQATLHLLAGVRETHLRDAGATHIRVALVGDASASRLQRSEARGDAERNDACAGDGHAEQRARDEGSLLFRLTGKHPGTIAHSRGGPSRAGDSEAFTPPRSVRGSPGA